MFIYLVYISPFPKMLYRTGLLSNEKNKIMIKKDPSCGIEASRQAKKTLVGAVGLVWIARIARAIKEEDNMLDRGYIFSTDESLDSSGTI
jgi:hypothetical protein